MKSNTQLKIILADYTQVKRSAAQKNYSDDLPTINNGHAWFSALSESTQVIENQRCITNFIVVNFRHAPLLWSVSCHYTENQTNIMYKLLISLILLCSNMFGQNDFISKINGVKDLGYFISDKKYQNKKTDNVNLVECEKNWYNFKVALINRNEKNDTLTPVSCSKIIKMETIYIKSKKPILSQFHGRAELQKWIFVNSEEANVAKTIIDNSNKIYPVRIEKAPWNFWVEKNCIYFIKTAGQYMEADLKALERVIKNNGS